MSSRFKIFFLIVCGFFSNVNLCLADFCDWASSDKVFEIENELARLGKFEGDPIIRVENLNRLRVLGQGSRSDIPGEVVGGTGQKVRPSGTINRNNLGELFIENLDGQLKGFQGAKGLAVTDANGTTRVLFWPTASKNGVANQVHHRDVAAGVLSKRSENLTQEAIDLQKTDKARANFLDSEARRIREHSATVGGPSAPRTHDGISYAVLEEMQGFKFSSQVKGGQAKVVRFEVDSAITGAQLTRDASVNVDRLARQIASIHSAISEEVKSYNTIHVKRGLYEKLIKNSELETLKRLLRSYKVDANLQPF